MKIKVDVSGLRKGMFVSELDRPWTETSFLLQGILIKDAEDISQLQETCEYVFIDAEKSDIAVHPHLKSISASASVNEQPVRPRLMSKSSDVDDSLSSASKRRKSEADEYEQNKFISKLKLMNDEPGGTTSSFHPRLKSLTSSDDKPLSSLSIAKQTKLAELEQNSFTKELKIAHQVHNRATDYITHALEDVRLGQAVDTDSAKEIVGDIASSITRSPHAMMWLTNIKERDEYTSNHCMNVCVLAISFGRSLGMDKEELEILGLGGLLHDLGKLRIPLEILNKPSSLTAEEFEIMKTHPVEGYEMLKAQGNVPGIVLDIVKHHHERRNGKGYPSNLSGDAINHLTRIVAIVDVYDAITSDRCYHDAITPYDALKNMYEWVNEDFDKEIIEQFIKCLGIYPIGCVVELNMGHVGLVVSASEKSKLRPIILLVQNSKKETFPQPKLINLAHPKWSVGAQKLEIKRILSKNEYTFNIKDIVANEGIL